MTFVVQKAADEITAILENFNPLSKEVLAMPECANWDSQRRQRIQLCIASSLVQKVRELWQVAYNEYVH